MGFPTSKVISFEIENAGYHFWQASHPVNYFSPAVVFNPGGISMYPSRLYQFPPF